MKEHLRGKIWGALRRPTLVKAFGGGETGEKIADFLHEIDYEMFSPWGPGRPGGMPFQPEAGAAMPTDPINSDLIKPNPTKSD